MAGERKSVVIHYRKFDRPKTIQHTLEQLVRNAMNTQSTSGALIKDRFQERLNTNGNDSYFVNIYHDNIDRNPLVFGDILHFTKGQLQALCNITNPNAATVPVQQMKAPAQSEYVHSQMFWMIKDDHVFVIQSMSLKTADLESYLEWFLKTKTNLILAAQPIILNSKFDAEAVGGDLEDIQEIIVGGVASTPTAPSNGETHIKDMEVTQHGHIDTSRRAGRSTATDVLKALLGGDANVTSLMKAVPADAELSVQVHIGYQTKKRKVDRIALRQIESGLRHLPDSQLAVKAKGAQIATDGTIRLHHKASIRLIRSQDGANHIVGSLLDPADTLNNMVTAYSTFLAGGKISTERDES